MPKPRNFLLLDALKDVQKYTNISYGLNSQDDIQLKSWNGSFFLDSGAIVQFSFEVPQDFPTKPPVPVFTNADIDAYSFLKSNTNNRRLLDTNPALRGWNSKSRIGEMLTNVRDQMNRTVKVE